jgi:hypothetical protein
MKGEGKGLGLQYRRRFAIVSVGTLPILVLGFFVACGSSTSGEPTFPGASSGAGVSAGSGEQSGFTGDDSSPGNGSAGANGSSGSVSGGSSGSSSAGGPSSSGASSGGGGSSGSSGSDVSDASGGSSGSTPVDTSGPTPTMLPKASGTCPTLKSGSMQSITLNGKAMSWSMSVGSKAATATGPIVIYWHGTGTNATESVVSLGSDGINDIVNLGGMVAAADSTSSTGTNTGDGVWYTGDVNYADFLIACAIEQLNIDTRHIHAAGYSAGALQTGYMWYARSGYLASTILYSGGSFGGQLQDPSNAPSIIGAHGAFGDGGCVSLTATNCDFLATSTTSFESAVEAAGAHMVIDCNDQSSHVDITRLSRLAPVAWEFFKDHPFKSPKPDAYAGGLPSGFPTYCKIL